MANERIEIEISQRGAEKVSSDINRIADSSQRTEKGLGRLKNALIGLGAGYAALRGIQSSVRGALDFNKALAEVGTIAGDIDLKSLESSIKSLSIQFGAVPTDQVKATYQIISAGASDAAEAVDILTASNKLAIGGVTNVATAADGITSVMNAYGDAAGNALNVSDKFFVAIKAGKTTADELSRSIGQVATIATNANVSLDDLLASVATLTKSGLQTSIAIAGVRQAIASVLKPTSEASKEAQRLGIQFDSAALASKGLFGFLEQIKNATEGSSDSLSKLFGSVEALTPVLSLVNKGSEDYVKILDNMTNSSGATDAAFKKMSETAQFKLDQAMASLTITGIELGSKVLPVIASAAQALSVTLEALGAGFSILQNNIVSFVKDAIDRFKLLVNGIKIFARQVDKTVVNVFLSIKKKIVGLLDDIQRTLGESLKKIGDNLPDTFGFKDARKSILEASTALVAASNDTAKIAESQNQYNQKIDESINKLKQQNAEIQKGRDLRDAQTAQSNFLIASTAATNINALTGGSDKSATISALESAFKGESAKPGLPEAANASEIVKVNTEADNKTKELIATMKEQTATFGLSGEALLKYRLSMGDLAGASEESSKQLLKVNETLEKQKSALKLKEQIDDLKLSFVDTFKAAVNGSQSFGEAFKKMTINIVADIARLSLQRSFASGGSIFGGFQNVLGGLFGGFRANGGDVQPGKIYMTGERGPEPFIPKSAGTILPNSALSGGGDQNITINTNVTVNASDRDDSSSIASQTARTVSENVKQIVRGQLVKEMRPGGLLAKGA